MLDMLGKKTCKIETLPVIFALILAKEMLTICVHIIWETLSHLICHIKDNYVICRLPVYQSCIARSGKKHFQRNETEAKTFIDTSTLY